MISFASLPLLHVGGPEPTGPLYTHWILDPRIALFVFGITGLYLLWVGPLNRRRPGVENRPVSQSQIRFFLLGSLILLIALGPPLDDWSHFFFVSAHMAQHLLLMFAVVPCWIKGVPPWIYQPIIDRRWSRWMLTWLPRGIPSFAIVALIMGLWHVPVLYDMTLENELVHTAQHMFFLLAGFLFYWPLMSTHLASPQLAPPVKCVYLFLQTIPAGIVGALITYAAPGLYPHYEKASVRPWGLSLKTDQEIAGLIMWVGMNTLFLVLLSVIFLRWAGREERSDLDALREESRIRRQQAAARSQAQPAAPDASVSHPVTH